MSKYVCIVRSHTNCAHIQTYSHIIFVLCSICPTQHTLTCKQQW